jgi:hypothetical protein
LNHLLRQVEEEEHGSPLGLAKSRLHPGKTIAIFLVKFT